MFLVLLLATFVLAALTATAIAALFARPIDRIFARLVSEQLSSAWRRYIVFAIYVVGISGGVRVWDVEKYVTPDKEGKLLVLTSDRWVIEIYKTIIGTLQSVAWMLLIVFLFALIAFVVMRGFEIRRGEKDEMRQPV